LECGVAVLGDVWAPAHKHIDIHPKKGYIINMAYQVIVPKKVRKNLRKLPKNIQERFDVLTISLRDAGPTGPHGWQNYRRLSENEYHCHLTYHYVACWRHEKGTITIEVYYAGSREDAPY
jgi:mRNA-degrading endonuclease RelE of RelBE toxin-antitoxin system